MVRDIPSVEGFGAFQSRLLTVSDPIIIEGLADRKSAGLEILLNAYTRHPDIPAVLGNATRIATLPIMAEHEFHNPDLMPGFGPAAWIVENAQPQLRAFINKDEASRGILRSSVVFSEDLSALKELERISQQVLPKGTYIARAFAAGVALREIAPDLTVPYSVSYDGSQ